MKYFGIICLSFLISCKAFCQPEKSISNKDTYNWIIGASWLLTDDDGESLNPFLIENLHSQIFPSRLTIDKYIYNSWSAECVLGYMQFNPNKLTNGAREISGSMFSMDFHGKYSLFGCAWPLRWGGASCGDDCGHWHGFWHHLHDPMQ